MNDVLRCHWFQFLWCFQARFLNLLRFRAVCGPFTFKATSWQDWSNKWQSMTCFVWFQLFHLFLTGLRESPTLDSPNAESKPPRFWTLHKWLLRYSLHKGRSIDRYLWQSLAQKLHQLQAFHDFFRSGYRVFLEVLRYCDGKATGGNWKP